MENEAWLWGPQFEAHLNLALEEIKSPKNHIAVDGGCNIKPHLKSKLINNWWASGDGDSACPTQLNQVYPQNKDSSDLAMVLAQKLTHTQKIRAFGFTGARLDHHMIALGCFCRHLQQTKTRQIRLDDHWLLLAAGSWSGKLLAGTVSLLPLEETVISLSGDWKWPLNNKEVLPLDDLLLSNQCNGKQVGIKTNRPLIIWSHKIIQDWWKENI